MADFKRSWHSTVLNIWILILTLTVYCDVLQIGCALGFVIPPEIVTNNDDITVIGSQLSIMLYAGAAVMTVLFILVLICTSHSLLLLFFVAACVFKSYYIVMLSSHHFLTYTLFTITSLRSMYFEINSNMRMQLRNRGLICLRKGGG